MPRPPVLDELPPTLEDLPPDENPRDASSNYQIAPNRVLLISFDERGDVFEEFRTHPDLATQDVIDRLMQRCRIYGPGLGILH